MFIMTFGATFAITTTISDTVSTRSAGQRLEGGNIDGPLLERKEGCVKGQGRGSGKGGRTGMMHCLWRTRYFCVAYQYLCVVLRSSRKSYMTTTRDCSLPQFPFGTAAAAPSLPSPLPPSLFLFLFLPSILLLPPPSGIAGHSIGPGTQRGSIWHCPPARPPTF